MKKKPLVTMITYCYNGERFVHKYFEALLAQTYNNIELIFYNNGSEDNTEDVINKYLPKLKEKGILCDIITLEKNNPQTCQLKVDAIKKMHGKYYFGCDSDDLLHPDYVEHMVNYLEKHPEKGMVYCQLNRVLEKDNSILSIIKPYKQTREFESFENIIKAEKTIFPCISYMMSAEWLDKINPNREFYISKFGENFQMQIPFLYNNLQGYIDEVLGDYLVREDSFSGTINMDKKYHIVNEENVIVCETLKLLGQDVYDKYHLESEKRVARDKFYISLHLEEKKYIKDSYYEMKKLGIISIKETALYIISKNKKLLNFVLSIK